MDVDMDLSGAQEEVGERTKRARRLTHRMALASLGLVGLTYDAGMSVCHSAGEFVKRAEMRGEEIEATLDARIAQAQEQMTEEAQAQRAKLEESLNAITQGLSERGKAVEKQIQGKLSTLKAGSGTVVETDQIKIEVEVVDSEPWEGYDGLNAQEVMDRLGHLDSAQLEAVRRYETNTKNRITVLREIEVRQAALEEEPNQASASGPTLDPAS
jgi:hypothetical protein